MSLSPKNLDSLFSPMKITRRLLCIELLILIMGVSPAPAQIVTNLGIVSAGKIMYVFWPAGDTNYVLQKAASANSTNWVAVNSGAPLAAVCITNASPSQFFRLYLNTNI